MRNAKYFGLAVLTAALVSGGVYRADDKKEDDEPSSKKPTPNDIGMLHGVTSVR